MTRGAVKVPVVASIELTREQQRSRQDALARAVRLELDTDLARADKDHLASMITRAVLRAQTRWQRALARGTV